MIEQDFEVLRELAAHCKDYKERERLRALYALSIGKTSAEVIEIFCITDDTLRNWVAKWEEERNLKDKERSGRPPAFSEKEKDELKKLVEEGDPTKHGLKVSTWDCSELAKYFELKKVNISSDTLRRYLKRMGARYVKAVLHYAEADVERQRAFALQFLQDLRGKIESAIVLFQDEMSAETSPRKGYGWTFEKRLVVNAPQKGRKKLNCFGAVDPFNGKIIEMTSENAKTPAFVRFLRKLLELYPGKQLWIYLDGATTHKSRLLKRFLAKHSEIVLKPLPPYSPKLNPKEYWHRHLRQKLLNNKPFANARALALAVNNFARNAPKEVVQSVCTLKPLLQLAS